MGLARAAAKEEINPSYVSRILRLTLLAPEIVEAVLDGRQAAEVTLPGLMEGVPVEWGEQRKVLAFSGIGRAKCDCYMGAEWHEPT